jgi:hypothetical protein
MDPLEECIADLERAVNAVNAAGSANAVAMALRRIGAIDVTTPLPPEALARVGELVRRAPSGLPPVGAGDPLLALVFGAPVREVRRLAGRVLDAGGERPSVESIRDRLGEAAALLAPYLEHSGATHEDLVSVTTPRGGPPCFLEGLRRAEQSLGPALLREVIGRLGWSRLSCGIAAQPFVGVSVGGSFPFVVPPAHASVLAGGGDAQTLWRRQLVIAHGGPPDDETAPVSDDSVARFRTYNVTHAQLLDEIIAVAPFDAAKARRILALMDRVVADFADLFGATSADAKQVPALHERLRARLEADLARDEARGELSSETVRRMQMFEDPQRLEDVTTMHGLKRYLHQQGLRLAFRLFRSEVAANRTVDLLVTGDREVLRCEQAIRYLEFEPTPQVGSARLPFAVSLLADALGRQLLHGRKLPSVTVLAYGNELQIYVRYRNHPAFIRIDLSPPLRGGLIDLEYFGASQYELDQHPDLSLQGIQRVLRELDFDVSSDGLRLRARYDKERALDLGDVVGKVRALFELLPYLMDVDWVIGDLDYPAPARAEVAAAWARFFARWGVVPTSEVLSASRLKIVVRVEPDAAGPREIVWDGRGPYCDRFTGTPPDPLGEALRCELERRGLGGIVPGAPAARAGWGQRRLDEAVLGPLAEAAARGEVRETGAGVEPVSADLFQRDHEAARLAAVLAGGGPRSLAPFTWRRWCATSSGRRDSGPPAASRATRCRQRPWRRRRTPSASSWCATRRGSSGSRWPRGEACSTGCAALPTRSGARPVSSRWPSSRGCSERTTISAPGTTARRLRLPATWRRRESSSRTSAPRPSRDRAPAIGSSPPPSPHPDAPPGSPASTPPAGTRPISTARSSSRARSGPRTLRGCGTPLGSSRPGAAC